MTDFYDRLAPHYHLLFDDWDAGIERQGRQLTSIIRGRWPNTSTVLDVTCGIGTQTFALAANGFRVTASDLSPGAIQRARSEAQKRNLDIAFSVCDVLAAHAHHGGGFDLVVSCDNALPHLLTDDSIRAALKQMFDCVRPGGGCIITVRDYEKEQRGKNILKPYGARVEGGHRYIVFQLWDFEGDFYDLTLYVVDEDLQTGQVKTEAMHSRYYAISAAKIMQFMQDAGFERVYKSDSNYVSILLGTIPA